MISSIIARQREEIKDFLARKLVEREITGNIKKYGGKDIVKIITGVRRSGKSTLGLQLLKEKRFGYVNFDEKELLNVKLDDLLSSIKEVFGDVNILFLDEIQNVDGWELWINSLARRGYNLLVTGSNAKLLSKELGTHLTGRYIEFETFPFSFKEFLLWFNFPLRDLDLLKEKQGQIKRLLRDYLKKGGFPELITKELDESYLKTLFSAIIYKDVIKRWNIKYPSLMDDLARYLVSISSCEFSFTKLRNILNFRSTLTVQKYMKYLRESYLFFSVERFSFKQKERIKAPHKTYVVDTGLINAISPKFSEDIGKLMENVVFIDLKISGLKENLNIFYFKDSQGREVDFVLKEGLKVKQLIQVTYASGRDEINNREIKALLKASELLNCKDLLVITWDYEGEEELKNRKIKLIPLWKWLLTDTKKEKPEKLV